ncbi:hypothetical protein [Halobellus sp. GM3]|uniref:hypothetical protein n=1 Tax=Halobellus sp. GM3 TaxID=3458410 RepID=UPI00403D5D7D
MVQSVLLAGFVVGVAIVVGIAVAFARGRYQHTPSFTGERATSADGVLSVARTPAAWAVSFVFLTLLAGGATVLAVGGFGVSPGVARGASILLAAVGGAVLVGYIFYGTFVAARARGLHTAQAAAFGSWAVGLLLLVAVAASLLGFA